MGRAERLSATARAWALSFRPVSFAGVGTRSKGVSEDSLATPFIFLVSI
jgi:hypothetical protein